MNKLSTASVTIGRNSTLSINIFTYYIIFLNNRVQNDMVFKNNEKNNYYERKTERLSIGIIYNLQFVYRMCC